VESSNIKGTLCSITSKSKHEFFNPFLSVDPTAAGAREDKKGANVS
jgi:hypothetical protein